MFHKQLTPEQLAENVRTNSEARKVFEAEMAAKEKAKSDAQDAKFEAQFKASARLKYSALSDADFERLWPQRIQDEELLLRAQAIANRPLESWYQAF
jgi:hypothetical protein